ncbi:serine/threonine-protein phosphatase 4 regulatory subunit 2-like [Lineus longissimus]|uniref:serine/threonine-protein phosphatase 4 regulatory subunit 2-like n=1 Tax=Lineus longissimus TaxID=88925 RepID=UPI002B4D2D66
MENKEDILDALDVFEKKPASEIPPLLEEYLCLIARTGETLFPWSKLKPLFIKKLDKTMCKFFEEVPTDSLPPYPNVENVKFEDMRKRILQSVEVFTGVPFTIQRLCELVTNPKKHYKRTDKFMRGIEKNVIVVSTVDPFGRKVNNESKPMINGMDPSPNNSYQETGAYNVNPSSPFAPPSWYAHSTAPPPNWNVKIDTTKVTNENGVQGNGDAVEGHPKTESVAEERSSTSAEEMQMGGQPTDHPQSSVAEIFHEGSKAVGESPAEVVQEDQKLTEEGKKVVTETLEIKPSLDLEAKEVIGAEIELPVESNSANVRSDEMNMDMTMEAAVAMVTADDNSSSSSSADSDTDASSSGFSAQSDPHDSPPRPVESDESLAIVPSQEDVIRAESAAAVAGEPPISESGSIDGEDDGPPKKRLREDSPPAETSQCEVQKETKEQQSDHELEVAVDFAESGVSEIAETCAKEETKKTDEVLPVDDPVVQNESEVVTEIVVSDKVEESVVDGVVDEKIETHVTPSSEADSIVTEVQVETSSEVVDGPSETVSADSDVNVEQEGVVSQSDIKTTCSVDSMETVSTDSGSGAVDSNTDSAEASAGTVSPLAADEHVTSLEQDSEKSLEEAMDQN